MRRIIVKQLVGSKATKPAVAWRLARKIQGAIAQRQCLLVDFEGTNASLEFLETLLAVAIPTKVRFCGLPSVQQALVNLRQKETS